MKFPRFKGHHLLVAALVVGAVLYFRQASGGYVGAVGAGRTSALPQGYRSDPPNMSGR